MLALRLTYFDPIRTFNLIYETKNRRDTSAYRNVASQLGNSYPARHPLGWDQSSCRYRRRVRHADTNPYPHLA